MKKMEGMRRLVFLVLIIFVPMVIYAQTDPGGFDDDVLDNPVPFDGGVSLLVAAGIGYGIKKVRDSRKNQKQVEE